MDEDVSKKKCDAGSLPLSTAFPTVPDEEAFIKDLRNIFSSHYFTNRGPCVLSFEKSLKEFFGNPKLNVVTVNNATSGLELALRAVSRPGKVILPSFTFVATANAVVNAGFEPVFADIEPDTLCLDPAAVEALLDPDVRVVMPVHVYGNIADVEYFETLKRRDIKIVYDSAHCFGVRRSGRRVCGFGHAEVFSFHSTKIMHSFEGGAIVTEDSELADRLSCMTNFGFDQKDDVSYMGTNAKMSEIHALMGLHSLNHIERFIEIRRRLVDRYVERLSGIDEIQFLAQQPDIELNGQYVPVLLPSEKTRDSLFEHLTEMGMFPRKYFYPPVHKMKPFQKFSARNLRVTEDISERILCFPLHVMLTNEHIDSIAQSTRQFFSHRRPAKTVSAVDESLRLGQRPAELL